jgi:hypothetical protein
VPGRTGQDILPEVIEAIAGHSNFAGVKECTGNERIKRYSDQVGGRTQPRGAGREDTERGGRRWCGDRARGAFVVCMTATHASVIPIH